MRRLGWALVGTLCGAILTQGTVFAGTQTAQVVLLIAGLAVGIGDRVARPRGIEVAGSSEDARGVS